MSEFWQHVLIAAAVIAITWLVAKFVDWRISRRDLPPDVVTRYRVLRRTIFIVIVFLGVMSALLVIPQVRAIAGGVLASGAVLALVIGFASQRTIGNFVAGILIAISQPLRLGDQVEVEGTRGIVEEIGLTYTWIRTRDNDRLVVPNERLPDDSELDHSQLDHVCRGLRPGAGGCEATRGGESARVRRRRGARDRPGG